MQLMSEREYTEYSRSKYLRSNFIEELIVKVKEYYKNHGEYPSVALVTQQEYKLINDYLRRYLNVKQPEGSLHEIRILGIALKIVN